MALKDEKEYRNKLKHGLHKVREVEKESLKQREHRDGYQQDMLDKINDPDWPAEVGK